MRTGETIRAGVAGAGVFGGYHAQKYAEAEDAALAAVFDPDAGRAEALAERHGARAFTEYGDFLHAVDVVTVATPAPFHAELAARAMERGRHVLVEKPLAMTLEGADLLVAMADQAGLVLQTGHQERYVARALGLLDRGAPRGVRSRRLNRFSGRAMDVSVVMDLMIHDLDLLATLAGTEQGEVVSCRAVAERGEHADRVDVVLSVGGIEAELSASRLEDAPLRDLHLAFEGGEVHLNFLTREVRNDTDTPLTGSLGDADGALELRDPLAYGTQSFLRAVREGARPEVSGQAGRAALRLALQVERAVEQALSRRRS